MKETTWELQSGLKFKVPTPTTVDEYAALAGVRQLDENSTGIAVLDDAIDNTMYRGPFADVRYALCDRLVKDYPQCPRQMKDKPGSKANAQGVIEQVYDESEMKYINRVAATVADGNVLSFQPLLDEIMKQNASLPDDSRDKIKFDPSQRERRGPSSAEPVKQDIETATALLGAGNKKLRIALSRISDAIGSTIELVPNDDPKHEAKNLRIVAGAVKAYNAWRKTQTKDTLLS